MIVEPTRLTFNTVESLDLHQAVRPYHELTLQAALAPGWCVGLIRRKACRQQLLLFLLLPELNDL